MCSAGRRDEAGLRRHRAVHPQEPLLSSHPSVLRESLQVHGFRISARRSGRHGQRGGVRRGRSRRARRARLSRAHSRTVVWAWSACSTWGSGVRRSGHRAHCGHARRGCSRRDRRVRRPRVRSQARARGCIVTVVAHAWMVCSVVVMGSPLHGLRRQRRCGRHGGRSASTRPLGRGAPRHQPGTPQHPQVLRDERLAHLQPLDQLVDVHEARSASSTTMARRAGAASTLSSSPAASYVLVAADTGSHKHMRMYLCNAAISGTCVETQSEDMFQRMRTTDQSRAVADTFGPVQEWWQPPALVLDGLAAATAFASGARLRRPRRQPRRDQRHRRGERVRQRDGPDRRQVRHGLVDPEQPQHRPPHLRVEPRAWPRR